jgi:hypothetical protein
VVREAGEEALGGGQVGECDEGKAFAFWESVLGVLVVWWEQDVLDGVVMVVFWNEGVQEFEYPDYRAE